MGRGARMPRVGGCLSGATELYRARFNLQTQRDAAAEADDSEFWHNYADAIDLSARRIAPR